LSDTVHFKHKHITNPALTHDDKIMKAVAELSKISQKKPPIIAKHEHEIRNLQQLMDTVALKREKILTVSPRLPADICRYLQISGRYLLKAA
jgi:hypothetical protein